MDLARHVPREYEENLRYRKKLREQCSSDSAFRNKILRACAEDPVFFFNSFCWIYEPRLRFDARGRELPKTIPFIIWPHQETAAREIEESLGIRDIGVEKSRGEGMSWMAVLFAVRDWTFKKERAIGFVSSTELKADNPKDPGSIMWKVDWEVAKLPRWMVGTAKDDYTRSLADHTLSHKKTRGVITAYAATGDIARGGRLTWLAMDEIAASEWQQGAKDEAAMASTQSVTPCRIFISTPKGNAGVFHRVMHQADSNVFCKICLDWKDNPTKNRGLYVFEDGVPKAVDPENNPLPDDYNPPSPEVLDLFTRLRQKGFKLEGTEHEKKLRSPWYDRECDRAGATPQSIAQELDRDYGGSMFKILDEDFFAIAKKTIKEPVSRGIISYNDETLDLEYTKTPQGQVKLWVPLDIRSKPPKHSYVIGCDICWGLAGNQTSNSVIWVLDCVTHEQVCEYVSNSVSPGDWADSAIAIAKWFHDAYLAWESTGPVGKAFTKQVQARGYENLFFRPVLWKGPTAERKEKVLGWDTNPNSKGVMFSEIAKQVKHGSVIIRSQQTLDECGQYVTKNGKIEHVSSDKLDDSSAGEAHGDRAIGMGVCIMASKDRPAETVEEERKKAPPEGSFAARTRFHELAQQSNEDIWVAKNLCERAGVSRGTGEEW